MTVSGILNVDKPPGKSSHDIVYMVRRGSGAKRVGHAGTLDPLATGVLLILVGNAVRVSEYLMALRKTYRATIELGTATTTYDAEGETIATHPVDLSEQQVAAALAAFEGEILQVPPAYSAVKVGGESAYRIARRGEDVSLKPRPAVVYEIELIGYNPPLAEVRIECGRGTYVRTIAHDLGQALGCGAHLAALERTRVGPFSVRDALTEPNITAALADGTWPALLQPMDLGLVDLPAITIPMESEQDLRHGLPAILRASHSTPLPAADRTEARAYAEDGSLIGILSYDAAARLWRPRKIFPN
jgi:tRNA pseudouridine55 synthase